MSNYYVLTLTIFMVTTVYWHLQSDALSVANVQNQTNGHSQSSICMNDVCINGTCTNDSCETSIKCIDGQCETSSIMNNLHRQK